MVPQNITTFQFIVEAVTGVDTGKKMKTQTTSRKATAPILIGSPARPNVQREDGKSPSRRLRMRHVKEIM